MSIAKRIKELIDKLKRKKKEGKESIKDQKFYEDNYDTISDASLEWMLKKMEED